MPRLRKVLRSATLAGRLILAALASCGLTFVSLTSNADPRHIDDAAVQDIFAQLNYESKIRAALENRDYREAIQIAGEREPAVEATDAALALQAAALIRTGEWKIAVGIVADLQPAALAAEDALHVINAYVAAADEQSASLFCEQALIGAPNNPDLLIALGRLRAATGRHGASVPYFERALALRSEAGDAPGARLLDELAGSYLALSRHADADALFSRYPHSDARLAALAAIQGSLAAGDSNRALALLERTSLPAASADLLRARILLVAGEPERAREALKAAEASKRQPATRLRMQIIAALAAADIDAARAYFSTLEKTANADPITIALMAMAAGDLEESRAALARAPVPLGELATQSALDESLRRASDVPQLALAYFRFQAGFHQLARAGLAADRGDAEPSLLATLLIAESARQTGDLDTALAEYKRLAARLPEVSSLTYLIGTVQADAGQPVTAEATLAAVAEARPDFILAQLRRVAILSDLGRIGDAITALNWSLNFKPDSLALHEALAEMLLANKQSEPARQELQRLKTLAGDTSPAILHLEGGIAQLENRSQRAREAYEQALRLRFENPAVMRRLADLYDQEGRRGAAAGLRALASVFEGQRPVG